VIAFVEVKARADLEVAALSISATKRRRIARAARVGLTRNPWAAGLTLRATPCSSRAGAFPATRRPRTRRRSTDLARRPDRRQAVQIRRAGTVASLARRGAGLGPLLSRAAPIGGTCEFSVDSE
jgi:hypothetical protein